MVTIESLQVEQFLALSGPIIDVRSPKEYLQGHIPNSVNVPLFSDEERHIVGLTYKQKGQKEAIEEGVKIVGPKLFSFLQQIKTLKGAPLRVYCFRGGMRSYFVSWFLSFLGMKVIQLKGGYKFFRRFVLRTVEAPPQFIVLAGLTGSGKTKILKTLKNEGEPVVDLEALANHKGSAFGLDEKSCQPSCEHFENLMALEFLKNKDKDLVWIEDESRLVGSCTIPNGTFKAIKLAPCIQIESSLQERIDTIIKDYGKYSKEYNKPK